MNFIFIRHIPGTRGIRQKIILRDRTLAGANYFIPNMVSLGHAQTFCWTSWLWGIIYQRILLRFIFLPCIIWCQFYRKPKHLVYFLCLNVLYLLLTTMQKLQSTWTIWKWRTKRNPKKKTSWIHKIWIDKLAYEFIAIFRYCNRIIIRQKQFNYTNEGY